MNESIDSLSMRRTQQKAERLSLDPVEWRDSRHIPSMPVSDEANRGTGKTGDPCGTGKLIVAW